MFRAETMLKVNILVLSRHVTELTRVLGRSGMLHLIDAAKQSGKHLLEEASRPEDDRVISSALFKVERLMAAMGVEVAEEQSLQSSREEMSLQGMLSLVDKIAQRYQVQAESLDDLLKKAGLTDRKLDAIRQYPLQSVSLDILHNLTCFYMAAGRLPVELQPRATLTLGDKAMLLPLSKQPEKVLVLAAAKYRDAVQEQLRKIGFEELAAPSGTGTAAEVAHAVDAELHGLRDEIEACRLEVLCLADQYGGILQLLLRQLKELQAVQEAQHYFGKVSHLYGISGWLQESRLEELKHLVDSVTGGSGVIEVISVEGDAGVRSGTEAVPVKLRGGAFARAFQLLICNFGIPNYREIDPTLFVGLTFTLFFGYMFGDIGQGAVLLAAGLWAYFTRRSLPAVLRDGAPLLIACGISAVFFGFAYGSLFGNETLVDHFWVNPLEEAGIVRLLITAVAIGVVVSSVAVIINIINHFLARKYFEGIFDRFGILGLAFYWAALGTGLLILLGKYQFTVWMGVCIALPLILLALKGPIHRLLSPNEEGEGLFNMMLECLLEGMETITGYMSGTVSFVRIGAFAISHAALCLAVFSIVKMLKTVPGGTFWGVLVMILGNLLVICFEGMVAMIQGVRLEYYELFGKFYSGDGVEFKPFRLTEKK